MLNYEEMQYFASFAETGTLSGVAEQFHISQPTITRAMKKAENEFGVPLFDRTKNSISLNDNGVYAAQEISILLKQTDETLRRVRAYDRANRTISIPAWRSGQSSGADPEAGTENYLIIRDSLSLRNRRSSWTR